MSAPISLAEPRALTCPSCAQVSTQPVWLLLDVRERPDLAAQVLAGDLDRLVCPHCGAQFTAPAPLLLHEAPHQYVLFAGTPGAAENQIRDEARDLVARLTAALPESRQLPYLSDLHVSEDRDGLRRAYTRRARRAAARGAAPGTATPGTPTPGAAQLAALLATPATPPEAVPQQAAARDHDEDLSARGDAAPEHATPEAAQQAALATTPAAPGDAPAGAAQLAALLLTADSPDEARDIVRAHPALLHIEADAALDRLAADARRRGDDPMAHALSVARSLLSDLRNGRPLAEPVVDAFVDDLPASLPAAALEAVLRADTAETLRLAVTDYPALLDDPADDALYALGETAALEGNDHAAADLDVRRERLLALRAELLDRETLRRAAQALVRAPDAAACDVVIADFPGLLATAAQPALAALADVARAQGRDLIATLLRERADLLRTVRAGLEGS